MRLLARNAAAASFTVTIAFSFRGRRGRLSGSAHLGFDGKEIASIHAGAKVPSARCRRAEPCVPTGAVGGTGSGRSALVVAGPPFEKCHRPNGRRSSRPHGTQGQPAFGSSTEASSPRRPSSPGASPSVTSPYV